MHCESFHTVCDSPQVSRYFGVEWQRRYFKGLFKRSGQHIGPTLSNTVECNMLASFEHHVDYAGRCWRRLNLNLLNIFVQHCWPNKILLEENFKKLPYKSGRPSPYDMYKLVVQSSVKSWIVQKFHDLFYK